MEGPPRGAEEAAVPPRLGPASSSPPEGRPGSEKGPGSRGPKQGVRRRAAQWRRRRAAAMLGLLLLVCASTALVVPHSVRQRLRRGHRALRLSGSQEDGGKRVLQEQPQGVQQGWVAGGPGGLALPGGPAWARARDQAQRLRGDPTGRHNFEGSSAPGSSGILGSASSGQGAASGSGGVPSLGTPGGTEIFQGGVRVTDVDSALSSILLDLEQQQQQQSGGARGVGRGSGPGRLLSTAGQWLKRKYFRTPLLGNASSENAAERAVAEGAEEGDQRGLRVAESAALRLRAEEMLLSALLQRIHSESVQLAQALPQVPPQGSPMGDSGADSGAAQERVGSEEADALDHLRVLRHRVSEQLEEAAEEQREMLRGRFNTRSSTFQRGERRRARDRCQSSVGAGGGHGGPNGSVGGAPRQFINFRMPKRYLEWHPQPHKYLFAICAAGRLSNRLRCFHIYMGLAALLNRTLVVPYKDIGSSAFSSNVCDFKWVFDVPHARTCFPRPPSGQAGEPAAPSPPVMLTFYEYLSQEQVEEMKLKLICLWPGKQPYGWCGFTKGCTQPVTVHPHISLVDNWCVKGTLPFNPTLEELLAKYGHLKDKVISFGTVNYLGFRNMDYLAAGINGPFHMEPPCRLAVQPNEAILRTAENIVKLILGRDFAGVHLRRGDFFRYCEKEETQAMLRNHSCWHPLTQVAHCLADHVEAFPGRLTAIFLATDAEEDEIAFLRKALQSYSIVTLKDIVKGPHAKTVRHPKWVGKWLPMAATERQIVALGKLFLATPGSTFSMEAYRVRTALGLTSCHDDYICTQESDAEALQAHLKSMGADADSAAAGEAEVEEGRSPLLASPGEDTGSSVRTGRAQAEAWAGASDGDSGTVGRRKKRKGRRSTARAGGEVG